MQAQRWSSSGGQEGVGDQAAYGYPCVVQVYGRQEGFAIRPPQPIVRRDGKLLERWCRQLSCIWCGPSEAKRLLRLMETKARPNAFAEVRFLPAEFTATRKRVNRTLSEMRRGGSIEGAWYVAAGRHGLVRLVLRCEPVLADALRHAIGRQGGDLTVGPHTMDPLALRGTGFLSEIAMLSPMDAHASRSALLQHLANNGGKMLVHRTRGFWGWKDNAPVTVRDLRREEFLHLSEFGRPSRAP